MPNFTFYSIVFQRTRHQGVAGLDATFAEGAGCTPSFGEKECRT